MNKLFVPYKIALTLRELRFNEPCLARFPSITCDYSIRNNLNPDDCLLIGNGKERDLKAPLYQQVIDWCIEKYGISIEVGFAKEGSIHGKAEYHIYGINNHNLVYHWGWWKSLSDARQFGILKAIELIKTKTQ